MKRYFILTIFLFCVGRLSAQNVYEVTGDFDKLELRGAVSVELIHSESPRVVLTTYGTDDRRVDYGIKKGKFKIKLRVGVAEQKKDIRAHVQIYYRDLSYIGIESAEVVCHGPVRSNALTVETLGGKNHTGFKVEVESLSVITGGHSKLTFEGEAKLVNINALWGAAVDAGMLKSEVSLITAKQKASVLTRVSQELHVRSYLNGTVYYIGSPLVYEVKKLGGAVIKIND